MIPESFDYQRASSVSEAISLLQKHGEDAKILAGGHSLVPTMKLRLATPGTLIDIGGISELKYINDKGDYLAIGARATHWDIESSDLVAQKAPALSQAAGQIGDVQVRNRGTIGGVLAHSDPQADYPGVVLALNATIVVQGSRGERTIAVSDYFTGLWETALGEDELLTEVRIPTDRANANSCYLKFPQPASRYPFVGCAVAMDSSAGNCSDVRIGFSGVGETAFRDSGVEDALRGNTLNESAIASASAKAADARSVLSDVFVSEEYRRAMAKVYLKRALTKLT
ncbi:MAG: xanthine dehydrogenase family protein subunit M [SAR324 cluster bacterium]|nr:xanthine dehydrogenase family protein subunit M [SAR324 cluster bacterium]